MYQHSLLAILNPPTGRKIGGLGAVEAMVKASVVAIREGDHKLSSFLSYLHENRSAIAAHQAQVYRICALAQQLRVSHKTWGLVLAVQRPGVSDSSTVINLPPNDHCSLAEPQPEVKVQRAGTQQRTGLSEDTAGGLLWKPMDGQLTLSKGMPYFFSIRGEIRVILWRRKASQL